MRVESTIWKLNFRTKAFTKLRSRGNMRSFLKQTNRSMLRRAFVAIGNSSSVSCRQGGQPQKNIHHVFLIQQQLLQQKAWFSSYQPLSPPPLFDLCVRHSFDKALERAKTHPHEARFKHPRNWTALHCCVEHVAPLEVVKAIYQAHPQSVIMKDWQGITPAQAAVDLDTKEYLQQQEKLLLKELEQKQSDNQRTGQNESSQSTIGMTSSNDPLLLGKALAHANNLSDQIADLTKTTKSLQKEMDDLKATLRALSIR
mgnify:CR=1 FL=1